MLFGCSTSAADINSEFLEFYGEMWNWARGRERRSLHAHQDWGLLEMLLPSGFIRAWRQNARKQNLLGD
jgi:hypothetical protein